MQYKLVLTPSARADIKHIGKFTEINWGREQRRRYLASLDETLRGLLRLPNQGKDVPEFGPGVRRLMHGREYFVFYRLEGDVIRILRVLNVNRDIGPIFVDKDREG